ncbi:O-linked-mannose beta-1-2-N-acetylglucosaminyltransferase 1-like 10, partial [Homarus americanus]
TVFEGVTLTTTVFEGVTLTETVFEGVTLTTTVFEGVTLTTTVFEGVTLTETVFEGVTLTTTVSEGVTLTTVFEGVTLTTVFEGVTLTTTVFEGVTLTETVFEGVTLTTVFEGVTLTTTVFEGVTLTTTVSEGVILIRHLSASFKRAHTIMSTRKLGRVILLAASVSVYLTGVQVVLEETLAQHPGAETFNNGQPHQQQEVKSRGRLTKRLHTTQEVPRPLQGGTDHLVLEARLEASGVTVWVDGVQVYRLFNKTLPWADNLARLHAGVHLLTLHERSGQVMRAATYLTWQPENNRQLSQALNDARDGRLLLLLATPEFTMFLGQEVVEQLKSLGSNFADRLAKYESWCLVAQKGVGVLHEVLTTVTHSLGSQAADASPTFLQLMVPLTQERQCGWYGEAGMRERATFCETYDGYGDFCSCDDPPWSPVPKNSLQHGVQGLGFATSQKNLKHSERT